MQAIQSRSDNRTLTQRCFDRCRQDMVEARVRRLPGYVERVELTRQKGPAYRLRQYASKVLGDMQHPYRVCFCGCHGLNIWAICSMPIRCVTVVVTD